MIEDPARVPALHLVTDDEVLQRDRWLRVATSVLESGGTSIALHLRGSRSSAAQMLAACSKLTPVAAQTGSSLIVNDRLDVALLGGARGVHLGRRSVTVEEARRLVPPSMWVGVSCHRTTELLEAREAGADYAFFGNVQPTPSHPGTPGCGLTGIERAVATVPDLPVIAIGGVVPDITSALASIGAAGVAAIRGVWDAEDPAEAVRRYLSALTGTQTRARLRSEPPARRA